MFPAKSRAFTLIEVLVSLALGSLVIGVVLSEVCGHVVRLSRIEPGYRAMLVANTVLEKAAVDQSMSSERGTENGLEYSIESKTVQADSRVVELKATVVGTNGRPVSLSIYRLRSDFGASSEE